MTFFRLCSRAPWMTSRSVPTPQCSGGAPTRPDVARFRYPPRHGRDLRETPIYQEVESFFRRVLEPGFGRITGPAIRGPRRTAGGSRSAGSGCDALEGHADGRICLVGGRRRPACARSPTARHDDDQPRWSPDGRSLTFRSDRARAGRHQLYVLDARRARRGAAAPRASPASVEQHAWSPDGIAILVVVAGLGPNSPTPSARARSAGRGRSRRGCPRSSPPTTRRYPPVACASIDVAAGTARRRSRRDLQRVGGGLVRGRPRRRDRSDGAGESAWYGARLVADRRRHRRERTLFDERRAARMGRRLARRDGVAVVEALCSDRLVVAGELLLVDPDERRRAHAWTRRASTSRGLAWRETTACWRSASAAWTRVALDVDAKTGTAEERWATERGLRRPVLPAARPFGDGVRAGPAVAPPAARAGRRSTRTARADLVDRARRAPRARSSIGSRRGSRGPRPTDSRSRGSSPCRAAIRPFPLILEVHGGPVWAYPGLLARHARALLLSRGYAILNRTRAVRGAAAGPSPSASSATWAAPTPEDLLAGVDHVVSARPRRPRTDRRDRRELRRVHVRAGSRASTSASRQPCRDLSRDRLVLRAFRQQPRALGGGLPRRRARRPGGALPRAQPGLRRPTATGPRRCSPPGRTTVPRRRARPWSSTGRSASTACPPTSSVYPAGRPRRPRLPGASSTWRRERWRGSSGSCRPARRLDRLAG